jgi:hypothetical protein
LPRNTGGITDGNFIRTILPEHVGANSHVDAHGVSFSRRLIVSRDHAACKKRYHLNLKRAPGTAPDNVPPIG